MTLQEFQSKIIEYNIPEEWYALNEIKPDALIIYDNYGKFEFFYLDEKGTRNNLVILSSIEDAYDKLWEKLKRQFTLLRG